MKKDVRVGGGGDLMRRVYKDNFCLQISKLILHTIKYLYMNMQNDNNRMLENVVLTCLILS